MSPIPSGARRGDAKGASPRQWAGLTGRARGAARAPGTPFVFLHGLTFDRRMWGPVLDALPAGHRAIAFDLPGHGDSKVLPQDGLAAVAEAVHAAERNAGLDRLRAAGTPYLTIHSCRIDPFDAAWLHERRRQAEILVWPVGHHFPHLTHPARLVVLLSGLAAGGSAPRTTNDNNDESEQT